MAHLPTMTMSDDELRDALEDANLPTLQVVLAHLTADRRWLAGPYRPRRTRALNDNNDAGPPVRRQAELREAAYDLLRRWRDGHVAEPCVGESEVRPW